MAYRDDLTALAARHATLESEVEQKTRELAESAHMLEEARARTRLPVLDNIRIASPCTARWADMDGDDRTRQCAACNKQVFDLSSLTRDEAQALISERAGELCGRYYRRADGTILLADCTIGIAHRRGRARDIAAAVVVAGAIAAQVIPGHVEARTLDGDLGLPQAHERISVRDVEVNPDPDPELRYELGQMEF
ncbi:MAG: hypothetical protein ABI867_12585 [Kofleriaceae bacterium]